MVRDFLNKLRRKRGKKYWQWRDYILLTWAIATGLCGGALLIGAATISEFLTISALTALVGEIYY